MCSASAAVNWSAAAARCRCRPERAQSGPSWSGPGSGPEPPRLRPAPCPSPRSSPCSACPRGRTAPAGPSVCGPRPARRRPCRGWRTCRLSREVSAIRITPCGVIERTAHAAAAASPLPRLRRLTSCHTRRPGKHGEPHGEPHTAAPRGTGASKTIAPGVGTAAPRHRHTVGGWAAARGGTR